MMNKTEATKLDQGSVWIDKDEDSDCWGVFGTESAFCYSLHASEEDANRKAEEFLEKP